MIINYIIEYLKKIIIGNIIFIGTLFTIAVISIILDVISLKSLISSKIINIFF